MKTIGAKDLPQVGTKQWRKEFKTALNTEGFNYTPPKTPLENIRVGKYNRTLKDIMTPKAYENLKIARTLVDAIDRAIDTKNS